MKKTFTILMATAVAAAVTACGGSSSAPASTTAAPACGITRTAKPETFCG